MALCHGRRRLRVRHEDLEQVLFCCFFVLCCGLTLALPRRREIGKTVSSQDPDCFNSIAINHTDYSKYFGILARPSATDPR
jgi:hypothetical protein